MAGAKGIRAGRAFVELFADDSRLVRGLKSAQAKLKAFGSGVGQMGTKMLAAGAAMAAPLGAGLKTFADFETNMSNVATLLDEPAKHIDGFKKAIREMSMSTGQTTEDLSKALYDLISASVDPAKAMGVLGESARAAKAGVSDVATATKTLINVMNAYQVPAERITEISDMLFITVKRGVTTFPELSEHIGTITATAYAAGLSLEELGAGLATMTRNGLRTDLAVTGLQNVLAEFLKPSEEGARIAQKYGFELSTMALKTEGLASVLQKLSKVPVEDIAKMFPDIRGLRGVLALRGDLGGLGKDLELMGNKAGATARAYSQFEGNLTNSFKKIKAIITGTMETVGDALKEPAKAIADWLEMMGRQMQGWLAANKQVITIVAGVAVGLLAMGLAFKVVALGVSGLGFAIGGLVMVLGILKVALSAVMSLMAVMLTPIGMIATAVIGLGIVIGMVTGFFAECFAWLKDGFWELAGEATDSVNAIGKALASGNIAAAAKVMWTMLKMEFEKGIAVLSKAWLGFRRFFLENAAHFMTGITTLWGEGVHSLRNTWIKANHGFLTDWAYFVTGLKGIWAYAQSYLTKAWNKLKKLWDSNFDEGSANKAADLALNQALAQAGQAADKQIKAAQKERDTALYWEKATHNKTMENIGKESLTRQNALDAEYNKRVADNEAAIAKARAEWQAAVKEASTPRPGKAGPAAPKWEELEKKLKAGLEEMMPREKSDTKTARGIFNVAGLQGLAGGLLDDRIAKAAEATAVNTKKIDKNTKDLKPAATFT